MKYYLGKLSEVLAGQEGCRQFKTEDKRFLLLFGFTALSVFY